jgi:excisionase family DNA binding protein
VAAVSAEGSNLLTVREVAARLRLHPETVRRWLRDGRLRGARIKGSGGYRVLESEVQRLLNELTVDHSRSAGSP